VVVAYPTNLKVTMLTIDEGDGMGLEGRIYVTTFLKSENVKTTFARPKLMKSNCHLLIQVTTRIQVI
jgi:hypothetical protein